MSDNHRPAYLPRLSVTLDAGTARAVTLAAAERMQSRADFIRDAVAHELSVRQAAADAGHLEAERQVNAARRLAAALDRGPGAVARRTGARVAALAQPSVRTTPIVPTLDAAEAAGKACP
nr:ribbon-helix-helix protein, CopG family [Methylobacterium sp. OTU13CASTA1]